MTEKKNKNSVMKRCPKCGVTSNNFHCSSKGRDGLQSYCKLCSRLSYDKYSKTKKGKIRRMYINQKHNSKLRGHCLPVYSLSEFAMWCLGQEKFHMLFNNWERSGYKRDLAPSGDRIDNERPYSFDNLRLTTWKKNSEAAHADVRSGNFVTGKRHVPVTQLSLSGEELRTFISQSEAARVTGINRNGIGDAVRGGRKKSGGFRWKRADEDEKL